MIQANIQILKQRTEDAAGANAALADEIGRFMRVRSQIEDPLPQGWGGTMVAAQKDAALAALDDKRDEVVAQSALVNEAWAAIEPL